MSFHLNCELPITVSRDLDHETPALTGEEKRILKKQIRKNSSAIGDYVKRLDLLLNKEKYPRDAEFLKKIRHELNLLMEENDTFREVLWRHEQN